MGISAIKAGGYARGEDEILNKVDAPRTKRSFGALVLLAGGLYVIAVILQLSGSISSPPAPDETHWTSRSNTILRRLKEHQFSHLTTHLPHPGIPGSVAMAAGQVAARKWNAVANLSEQDAWYLDDLTGSRLGAIASGALIVPATFIVTAPMLGAGIAAIAALLFSVDPYTISVGKQAHIDSSLSLLMCFSALLFMLAIRRESLLIQIAAAITWGLAMASKPTAILLLPALAIMRLYSFTLSKHSSRLIYARDLWSVVLGASVFTATYSRLWHHWTNEQFKLNPWKGADVWSDRLANALAPHSVLLSGLAGACIILLVGTEFQRMRKARTILPPVIRVGLHILGLISLLACVLMIRPELLHNWTGYLAWVFGLADTPHFAYGRVWEPPPWGYIGLFLSKLPTLVLLGVCLSPLALLNSRDARTYFVLSTSTIICVVGGLSVSDKQAYRYILPVLPLVYTLSVLGFISLGALVAARSSSLRHVGTALLAICVCAQLANAYTWRGSEQLFSNAISGGLTASLHRGTGQAFVRQEHILRWLQEVANREGREIRVGVIGDFQTMRTGYHRLIARQNKTPNAKLNIRNWTKYDPGEYIVVYHSMLLRMGKDPYSISNEAPVLEIPIHGTVVASIFRPSPPTDAEPLRYRAAALPRRTGGVKKIKNKKVLYADPRTHRRDYLFYNSYVRVVPGEYEITLTFNSSTEGLQNLDPTRLALRVELGSKCQSLIPVSALLNSHTQRFLCSYDAEYYLQLRAYWFGYAPVELYSVEISRSKNDALP